MTNKQTKVTGFKISNLKFNLYYDGHDFFYNQNDIIDYIVSTYFKDGTIISYDDVVKYIETKTKKKIIDIIKQEPEVKKDDIDHFIFYTYLRLFFENRDVTIAFDSNSLSKNTYIASYDIDLIRG